MEIQKRHFEVGQRIAPRLHQNPEPLADHGIALFQGQSCPAEDVALEGVVIPARAKGDFASFVAAIDRMPSGSHWFVRDASRSLFTL
ncbi:MAG: hypothetical protein B9S38_04290 [Verrucomicrobiia bacterium Tous-C4TDCM]|nr:MAG: hypothetical protein B9S38_04290 [Verrucomicrobiae bacterium Tous-C4TDCM]